MNVTPNPEARWGCFRCGLELPLDQAPATCPNCPPGWWYTAEIAGLGSGPGQQLIKQRVEGTPETVAAFLRAAADQIHPPKRPTRAQQLDTFLVAAGIGTVPSHSFEVDAHGNCQICGGTRRDTAHRTSRSET